MSHVSQFLPANQETDFFNSLKLFPPRAIRLRTDCTVDELPFATESVAWNSQASLLCDSNIRPSQFLEYAVANYYIQDAGSMLSVTLANIQPDDIVCDLCAAPGGKSSAMLEQLTGSGLLFANEVIASRVSVLEYNLARTSNPRFLVLNRDPEQLTSAFYEKFDVVLVDAPCSGQTLTIKNKRAENAFDIKHIEHAAARQRRILDDAIRMVKVGGYLVYSTCTFADEENEQQIERLLAEHPNALKPYPDPNLAAWESLNALACYRLWPHRDPTAGAFAARLRKCGSIAPDENRSSSKRVSEKSLKSAKKANASNTQDESATISHLGELQDTKALAKDHCIHGMNALAFERLAATFELRELVGSITKLAEFSGGGIQPHHFLAMMTHKNFMPKYSFEVDDNAAKQFVSGSALTPSQAPALASNATCKFSVAMWKGQPLGWTKWAGNRWNNLVPAVARLSFQN